MSFEAIYMHIPFCQSKCNYCDFLSFEEKTYSQDLYTDLLIKEIELYSEQSMFKFNSNISTLYFGGGTPSLLTINNWHKIFKSLEKKLFINKKKPIEISIEANPGTVDYSYLKELKQLGVNRISLGAQSFSNQALKSMGRKHQVQDIINTYNWARKANFANISLDLIYGWPQQDLSIWQKDLMQIVKLEPEHISLYGLNLSEESKWGRDLAKNKIKIANQDLSAQMWEEAIKILNKYNYDLYEISNLAKPGYESKHNLKYWQRKNYLGLGLSAASCYGNKRWVNTYDYQKYQNKLAGNKRPLGEEENLDFEIVIAETIFLALRLKQGVNFKKLDKQFDRDISNHYYETIAKLEKLNLLIKKNNNWCLTLKGQLLGNEVFAEFLP